LTEYLHDNTNQLIDADHTGQTDESYSFDENGNRTMSGYSIGDNNQLLSDGTYDYEYDAEGNRTAKETIATGEREEYAWDHRNRLVTITFKNSGGTVIKTVDQLYDAFNQWIRRRVDPDGATGSAALQDTYFSHLDNQIVLQFDGDEDTDLTNRDLWNPAAVDQILADEAVTSLSSAGTVLYPLTDHLGTTRDLTSYDTGTNTTTIESHRRFDAFGVMVSQTNSSFQILFLFTGRPYDDSTNIQNNINRWYGFGIWLNEDPSGFNGQDSNLARYVGNHPTVSIDPTGLVDHQRHGIANGPILMFNFETQRYEFVFPGDPRYPLIPTPFPLPAWPQNPFPIPPTYPGQNPFPPPWTSGGHLPPGPEPHNPDRCPICIRERRRQWAATPEGREKLRLWAEQREFLDHHRPPQGYELFGGIALLDMPMSYAIAQAGATMGEATELVFNPINPNVPKVAPGYWRPVDTTNQWRDTHGLMMDSWEKKWQLWVDSISD
jgi:RHS repeat-associated protein